MLGSPLDKSGMADSQLQYNNDSPISPIFTPVTLPSGATLKNRLVKVAMYEHLATIFGGPPNALHCALYSTWAKGGWGMIISGNVQVSRRHLTLGRDMVVPRTLSANSLQPFQQLAASIRGDTPANSPDGLGGPLAIIQLSHAGRQSPTIIGGRPPFVPALAPSPLALGQPSRSSSHVNAKYGWFSRLVLRAAFQTPRAMTASDIEEVIDDFVRGARVALESGFNGIELHASHGYLIAQFISPKSNIRRDEYSAESNPLHLLHRITAAIRAVTPSHFVLGVKINSADYVDAGSSSASGQVDLGIEGRAVGHVAEIASWGMVDFIEISGGDYENPDFMATSGQAFFSRFARRARTAVQNLGPSASTPPFILLTGGLRSPEVMNEVLLQGHADMLGIGRGSVLRPDLPCVLSSYLDQPSGAGGPVSHQLYGSIDPSLPNLSYPNTPIVNAMSRILTSLGIFPLPKLIGAGLGVAWYVVMMRRLARGRRTDYKMGGIQAMVAMWAKEMQVILFFLILVASSVSVWVYRTPGQGRDVQDGRIPEHAA